MTSLVAVSFDRFWAICFPISYHNKNTPFVTKTIIIISWIFPFAVGSLPIFDAQGRNRFQDKCIVTTILNSNVIIACTFFTCLGCLLMMILYSFIYCRIKKQVRPDLCFILIFSLMNFLNFLGEETSPKACPNYNESWNWWKESQKRRSEDGSNFCIDHWSLHHLLDSDDNQFLHCGINWRCCLLSNT